MDRKSQERRRSLPTPKHQKKGSRKAEDEFNQLRREMERKRFHFERIERMSCDWARDKREDEIEQSGQGEKRMNYVRSKGSVLSTKQFPINFFGNKNYFKKQRTQLESSQQKPEQSDKMSNEEEKYRYALRSLENSLRLDPYNQGFKQSYKTMVQCFQSYRHQEIKRIKSIRQGALSQKRQQRKRRIKQIDQKYEEQNKNVRKLRSQHDQLMQQCEAAQKKSSPEQQNLKQKKKKKYEEYKDQNGALAMLRDDRKDIYKNYEEDNQKIEREFALILDEKQRMLERQREIHENIKKRIEKKGLQIDIKQRLKAQLRHINILKLGRLAPRILSLASVLVNLTIQMEFVYNLLIVKEIISSKEFEPKLAQQECKQLRYQYQMVTKQLRKTINIQEKLIPAEQRLEKTLRDQAVARQQLVDARQKPNLNNQDLEDELSFCRQTCELCQRQVSKIRDWLETLNNNARRYTQYNVDQLQTMLRQLYQLQVQLVDIENRVSQRAGHMTRLEALRKQRKQVDVQHDKITEKMHYAEGEASKEQMEKWTNQLKELEKERQKIQERLREIEFNKKEF